MSINIGDKAREVLAAQAHIWNHTFSYINSMSLKCAIQLGIPDIIHSHGRAMTLSELVNALPIFEYAEKESGFNCLFNEAMASDAPLIISIMIEHCKEVFEGLKSIVDVGGGTGTTAKAIADAFPKVNCIVLDLPHAGS
ncbi:PREDICTED: 8-hydroxyquercetin 8-O-methyltransferase-like [Nicotiana attenuata]|uniref:8-hydroxyquercetin 8-O-methyltransferase-like n=1 Tax=Nicotiana attenuata TaxID=49451 RepID=UPI00090536E8|nr:PREDICTED: 8-hydroxyquercetin 8-O-methyltransferase-like [Nicotiana attenuata]